MMIGNKFDMVINSSFIPRHKFYKTLIEKWRLKGNDMIGETIYIFSKNVDLTIDEIRMVALNFPIDIIVDVRYKETQDISFLELKYKNKHLRFKIQSDKALYLNQRGNQGCGVIVDVDYKSMQKFLPTYNELSWLPLYTTISSEIQFGIMWIY